MPEYDTGRGMHEGWTYNRYNTVKNKGLEDMEVDIRKVLDNLINVSNPESFVNILTQFVTEQFINFCVLVLEQAVERAPYKTGKLRRSGKVEFTIGRNVRPVAHVELNEGRDYYKDGTFQIVQTANYFRTSARRIEAEISFERIWTAEDKDEEDKRDDPAGRDIALWTHEELLPWVSRPKSAGQRGYYFARQAGIWPKSTGPKYLELAGKFYSYKLSGMLRDATTQAIKVYNKKHGARIRRRRIV